MLIIAIIAFGLLVGGLAQLLMGVPMRDVQWGQAVACGLIGSFVGGLIISLLLGDGLQLRASGLIGSLLGALLVTIGWTWATRRRA